MDNLNNEAIAEVVAPVADMSFEEVVSVESDEMDLSALDALDFDALDEVIKAAENDATAAAVDDDMLQDLDLVAARTEAYENQEAASMPDIADTVASAGKPVVRVKKAKATGTGSTKPAAAPRPARELAALPVELFDLNIGSSLTDAAALEANKTAVIAKRPGQVKIAEKFDNLFVQIAAGKLPSVYVMKAFDALSVKGSLSSSELIAHYRASGLGDGTARSQCGQIMVLFDAVGIAGRIGHTLTLEAGSTIAQKIRDLKAPAPATV